MKLAAAAEYRRCSADSRDGVAFVAGRQKQPTSRASVGCGLTGRSSGPPTARHQAREAARVIIRLAGLASHRRRPLSSNVRPHSPHCSTLRDTHV